MKTLAAADKNSRDRQRQIEADAEIAKMQNQRYWQRGKNQLDQWSKIGKIRCDLQDNQKAKDDKNRKL